MVSMHKRNILIICQNASRKNVIFFIENQLMWNKTSRHQKIFRHFNDTPSSYRKNLLTKRMRIFSKSPEDKNIFFLSCHY